MTDISPQQVRTATFRTTRKGYDPDEVAAFLRAAAEALEVAQNQSAAMEARARAAVARLQELSGRETPPPPTTPARPVGEITAPPDEAATISRTLLLAQRTADQTVAEARAEAERVLAAARAEAESTIDSTREMSARLVDDARVEARAATESERRAAEGEVMSLLARRDFLVADVDHLEAFLVEQRERIRDAAAELTEICDRVPAGLAGVRRPLLSAVADGGDDDDPIHTSGTDDETQTLDDEAARADHDPDHDQGVESDDDGGEPTAALAAPTSPPDDVLIAPIDAGWPSGRSGASEDHEPTMAMHATAAATDTRGDEPAPPEDATPASAEPPLSFDAADLRRLGETRGID